MKLSQLYNYCTSQPISLLLDEDIDILRTSCSQFLADTSLPLVKTLTSSKAFYKLKARYRKADPISENINYALQIPRLLQRSVTVNGLQQSNQTKYYVFPINGYKFIYSDNIVENDQLYTMFNNINNSQLYRDILIDLSHSNNINEAILSNNQILIYNIPYCYCINANVIASYTNFLKTLRQE